MYKRQTKQGKEGKAQVTWRSTVGWASRAIQPYDMVDQKEFVQLTYEALRNGYVFNSGYSWEQAQQMARAGLSANLGGELYNPFKNYTWDNLINPETGMVQADAVSAWNEPVSYTHLDVYKRQSVAGSIKLNTLFAAFR